ncbi:hypothetical protein LTR95_014008 [Oleoguttula sp. CCFEE 5521]
MAYAQRAFGTYLVTPSELHNALKSGSAASPRTIPICGSWFLPNDPQKRTGLQVFKQGHIPGARFFDLDKVSDTSSPYPHMLPSPEVFRDALSTLGVKSEDRLVVYDTAELGIFSAPRVAWTLKVFGHPSVHLLNNFKLYVEQDLPVEAGEGEKFARTDYALPNLDKSRVASFEAIKAIAKESSSGVQVLDARSSGRWQGVDPEPRPGLSSGHIPGSISIPVPELLDPTTKTLLPGDKLKAIFESKGIDPNAPIVSSCGTGVTATIIDTALIEAGFGEGSRRIYDGSWTEWAMRVQPEEGLIKKVGQ